MVKYEVIFLEPGKDFLENLDNKSREKILFNIWKSRETNDPSLFRKLSNDIWEFRTRFKTKQFRLLAFWDRDSSKSTLVIATHGFVKKTQRIPKREIDRAEQ
jgi:phage-related protein